MYDNIPIFGSASCKCMFCIKSTQCPWERSAHHCCTFSVHTAQWVICCALTVGSVWVLRCDATSHSSAVSFPTTTGSLVEMYSVSSPAGPNGGTERRHQSGCMRTHGRQQSTFRWWSWGEANRGKSIQCFTQGQDDCKDWGERDTQTQGR